MAFRQRIPSFRPQLSMRRVYETLEPRSETQELPEAYLLRVYLPGFPRDSVKITYVATSRTVRITGERQLQGIRWHKIDQSYPVPDYCEAEALEGKFDTQVLTLTMPKKKAISQDAVKQQEVETHQEKGVVAEPKPDEKGQEITPPAQPTATTKVEEPIEEKKSVTPPSPDLREQKKATFEETRSQIASEPIKDQKGQEGGVERVGPSEPQMGEKELEPKPTLPIRAATMQTYEKPQKVQQEFESKQTPTRVTTMQKDEKLQKGEEEFEPRATPTMLTKVKTAERTQKDQEEYEAKPTQTMLTKVKTAEKPQKNDDEFEAKSTQKMEPKTKTDEQPPKVQEEVEPKLAITNVTRKPTIKDQIEEKKRQETIAEDSENERISKKEDKKETSDSRKPVKNIKQGSFEEKETNAEKLLAKEAEPSSSKKKKEKKKRKSEENAVERGGSVSQVFTKVAEGMLSEEEKKLAANIGAAVLVIAALGYCVSNTFAS
ncbi:hypothetical protein VNO78_07323 [Psophocarpus tetragonolobus]|uniref:SHSP domain-containing protein n=1 Tax=Psophocarpus tetragonolobus TaxID=3891 RepID=A0AAN9XRT9_PSOTE